MTLQHGRHAARRCPGADRLNECVHRPVRLSPNLLAERIVAGDAVHIAELVRHEGFGFAAQLICGGDHVEDQLLRSQAALAGDKRQIRAECRHVIQLLAAECVGGHDPDAVALGGADQGERRPGAPACVLNHGVAGLEPAVLLGAGNHRQRHTILHAAGRVLPFELDRNLRAIRRHDAAKLHERRVSDCLQDVASHVH